MGLVVSRKSKSNVPPMEAGTYAGVCVGVIDLGEQYNANFKNYSQKLMMIFEFPGETVEIEGEAKPRWLSKEYTQSLSDKSNLKKDLTSWLGRALNDNELDGFDLFDMLGKGCFISLIIDEKENGSYNKISAIMGLPKGMPAPTTETKLMGFTMEEPDENLFEVIPEWIVKKIKGSTQWQKQFAKVEELDIDVDENGEVKDDKAPF